MYLLKSLNLSFLKKMKEEELEFISVTQDDDYSNNMNNQFGDSSYNDGSDTVIGSWMFKQSKVYCRTTFFVLLAY